MAAKDGQDDGLFDFRDNDDGDVDESDVLFVNGSALSHFETAEAPSIHYSLVATESLVITITSSPIVATDESSEDRKSSELGATSQRKWIGARYTTR